MQHNELTDYNLPLAVADCVAYLARRGSDPSYLTTLGVSQLLELAALESKAEMSEQALHLSNTALGAQGSGKDIKNRLKEFQKNSR